MNIIMISTDFLPNIGGIASHVYHLSLALQHCGHQVVVVNPVETSGFSSVEEEIDGLRVYRLTYPKTSNMLLRLWRRTFYTLKILHQIAAPFDHVVLHQHDHLNSTLTALLFRRNSDARWVWTNHTSTFLMDMESPFKRLICRCVYRNVDGIIGVSKERTVKALRLFKRPKPGVFIANGVDPAKFAPAMPDKRQKYGLSPDHFVVLCPSRMVPVKGVIYLAKSVNLLLERSPEIPWQFVFLGNEIRGNDVTDKGYIDEVKALLNPAQLRGVVTYLGNVPPDCMPEVYAVCDVVALPSLMEAVSLSALEAMASSKPVVASRIDGLLEIIRDRETGLLVPVQDAESLAQALYVLYENRQLREQLAENAEQLSQLYTWERIAEKTVEFYKEILSQR